MFLVTLAAQFTLVAHYAIATKSHFPKLEKCLTSQSLLKRYGDQSTLFNTNEGAEIVATKGPFWANFIKELRFDFCGFTARNVAKELIENLIIDSAKNISNSFELAKEYGLLDDWGTE
jgi:hypothetical protein